MFLQRLRFQSSTNRLNVSLTLHVAIGVQLQISETVTQLRAHSYLTRVLVPILLALQLPHALQGVKIKSLGDVVRQGWVLHGLESVSVPGQSEGFACKLKQSLSSTVLRYNKNGFFGLEQKPTWKLFQITHFLFEINEEETPA